MGTAAHHGGSHGRTRACQARQPALNSDGRSLLRESDWVPAQTGSMKPLCLLMSNHSPVIRPTIFNKNSPNVNLPARCPEHHVKEKQQTGGWLGGMFSGFTCFPCCLGEFRCVRNLQEKNT